MEKLEVGQIVRIVADKLLAAGFANKYWDFLEVTGVGIYPWATANNLRTGEKGVRIYPIEVKLAETIRVRMVKTFNYRNVWLSKGSELNLYMSGEDFSAIYIGADGLLLNVTVDYFEVIEMPDSAPEKPVEGRVVAYKDLRMGDQVSRTQVFRDGTRSVQEGVIARMNRDGARSQDGVILARAAMQTVAVSDEVVLLNRELSEFESAGVGSIATTATDLFVEEGVNSWRMFSKEGNHFCVGVSNQMLKENYVGCKVTYKV